MTDSVWRPEPPVTYRIWHDPPWGWAARMNLKNWRDVSVSVGWLGWSKDKDEAQRKCLAHWDELNSIRKESSDGKAV